MDKTRLNRADLLRCIGAGHDDDTLERLAPMFGFHSEYRTLAESKEIVANFRVESPLVDVRFEATTEYVDSSTAPVTGLEFPVVTHYIPRKQSNEKDLAPEWFQKTGKLRPEDNQPAPCKPPAKKPLTPRARLWPFLRFALGGHKRSHRIDVNSAVKRIAKGQPLNELPRKQRHTWHPRVQVLIDLNRCLTPFYDDFNQVCRLLVNLRGANGLEILLFDDGFGRKCRNWFDPHEPARPYLPPDSGTPVLLLTDHGNYGDLPGSCLFHERFSHDLSSAGVKAIGLLPCPIRLWSKEQSLTCFPWDRDNRLPSHNGRRLLPIGQAAGRDEDMEQLLTLLSPAVFVEPALLRVLRLLLPASCDVGLEAGCWNHPAITAAPDAMFFDDHDAHVGYRELFRNHPLRNRAADLIRQYHAHLHPSIIMEEELTLWDLLATKNVQEDADSEIRHKKIRNIARRMVKSVAAEEVDLDLVLWVKRVCNRLHSSMFDYEEFAAAVSKVYEQEIEEGKDFELPEGLAPDKVAWVLKKSDPPRVIQLRQQGSNLMIEDTPPGPKELLGDWEERGSLLAHLTVRRSQLQWKPLERKQKNSWRVNSISYPKNIISLHGQQNFHIRADQEEIIVTTMTRPDWASAMGRDQYGLWAEFTVESDNNKVVQRMRWIPPGRFLMGSPPKEPERMNHEQQHEVIISKGFWLADTACTQELWQVAMNYNPSKFKGERRPVENVSWANCRNFLSLLEYKIAGLHLRLPTEAEWEYGCRAGTTTPFWFGYNITPELVNYNGNEPYARGKKCEYRQETVKVDELPLGVPNDWGLFQMQGNVWEWVADDMHSDYNKAPTNGNAWVDSPRGDIRVVRGGSWINSAGRCRSASRDRGQPGYRIGFQGFRFARDYDEFKQDSR